MFSLYLLVVTILFTGGALIWHRWPTQSLVRLKLFPSYDFIIVGGGTAGCVLADRLSEDAGFTVLLLEAGNEELKGGGLFDVPFATREQQLTDIDWKHQTEPLENAALSFEQQRIYWSQGRLLGGSGGLSYLVYARGSPHDYDNWAAMGLDGWSYKDVLPYFKKSENNQNRKLAKSGVHGTDGPLYITDMGATPLGHAMVDAGVEIGYKTTDINSERQIGISTSQATVHMGRRWTTVNGYLRPAMQRLNLHVATLAHATKVVFEGTQAVGVEFVRNKTEQTVRARREVIISAGVIGSPHLLMLSGIGPQLHLKQHGIKVVADLPVGKNLQDHTTVLGIQFSVNKDVAISDTKAKTLGSLMSHIIFGQGVLSSSLVEANGFFKVEHQPANSSEPYLQLSLYASLIGTALSREKQRATRSKLRLKPVVFEALFGANEKLEGFTFFPTLLHPTGRGTVRLASSNPHDSPIISPKYLTSGQDELILLDGIRLAQRLASTISLKQYGAKLIQRPHPNCMEEEFNSDEYWQCFIHQMTFTSHNPVGTCAMGPANSSTAVVDANLKVKGLQGLRVVDSSVMPVITSGNTYAPTVMIAEKAADLILSEHPHKDKTSHVHFRDEL